MYEQFLSDEVINKVKGDQNLYKIFEDQIEWQERIAHTAKGRYFRVLYNTPIEDIVDWANFRLRGEPKWKFKKVHFTQCPKINVRHEHHAHILWDFNSEFRISIVSYRGNPVLSRIYELQQSLESVTAQRMLAEGYEHSEAHGEMYRLMLDHNRSQSDQIVYSPDKSGSSLRQKCNRVYDELRLYETELKMKADRLQKDLIDIIESLPTLSAKDVFY